MALFRQTANVIELARDLMAVISPATGVRSSGVVRFTAETADTFLQRNWAMVPVVNGVARDDLLFKVAEGPSQAVYREGTRVKATPSEPDAQSWWTITSAGVDVDVTSIIGGARHNLKSGTTFILDPKPEGIDANGVLLSDMVNGADPTHFAGCMSVTQFEQLGSAGLDTFRAQPNALPAVVIVWSNTEPADGTTQSPLSRANSRVGSVRQLFKEHFNLFVISRRDEGSWVRRAEGLKLLDDVVGLLSDRQAVDGEVFSAPTGIQFTGRSRVMLGDNSAYQNVYVYVAQLAIVGLVRPYDFRTYNPWLRTNATYLSEKNEAGERLTLVDHSFLMTTELDEDEMTVVSSLAALSTLTDKELAWVSTLKCYYHRNQFSTQTPDGFMVISTTTAGNWERMVETTSRDWLSQAQWFVDPVLGNDENTGSSASPIASLEEFGRRVSVGELRQDTIVNLVAGSSFGTVVLSVDAGLFRIIIRGVPTTVATGTVATYSSMDHVTPQAPLLTSNEIADWTVHAERRIRITSGTGLGTTAYALLANPRGLGVNVLETSVFAAFDETWLSAWEVAPAPGDAFVIETLPTINSFELTVKGRGLRSTSIYGSPEIQGVIRDVRSPGLSIHMQNDSVALVEGCIFKRSDAGSIRLTIDSPSYVLNSVFRCGAFGTSPHDIKMELTVTNAYTGYCGFSGLKVSFSQGSGVVRSALLSSVFQSCTHVVPHQNMIFTGIQFFDASQAALIVGSRSYVTCRNMSGSGNAIGLICGSPYATETVGPIHFSWLSTTPNLQATIPIQIRAGLTVLNLTWSDVPMNGDAQNGSLSLVNGTVSVTARYADLRSPRIWRADQIGTPGFLSVPTASRTPSGFVIESRDSAGNLVADNSVVQWEIPEMVRDIRIYREDSFA